jgi:ParB family chromosome partitioning protein
MGVRQVDSRPPLAPVPLSRDLGRRPSRSFGEVPIDQVVPDPSQPRVAFPEEAIHRLALSIQEQGQLSPIRVRWSEQLGKWMIICGERRWRAVQHAGLATITCFFHDGDLSESEVREQQLIENCLREDLQPIEEARAFAALMKLNGWNGRQLAEALRVTPSKITRALALLRLPDDVQGQVQTGAISGRSAYELSKLADPQKQRNLAERVIGDRLDHAQTARLVRQRKGIARSEPKGTQQTFFAEDGWKVVVSASKKATYLEIERALSQALEEVRHRIANGCRLY